MPLDLVACLLCWGALWQIENDAVKAGTPTIVLRNRTAIDAKTDTRASLHERSDVSGRVRVALVKLLLRFECTGGE